MSKLQSFHAAKGAVFADDQDHSFVTSYGGIEHEYTALTGSAAVLDFSARSRICLLGKDRVKFLHGQVTNDIARLTTGQGCYAALINAKGRLQSDLFVWMLHDEVLLDFEPGLTSKVTERFEKYIIADDVQVVDVAQAYGLLTIQGPASEDFLRRLALLTSLPIKYSWQACPTPSGEVYVMNNPRLGTAGYDLFVPVDFLEELASSMKMPWAGLAAFETARIETGIPRFGADMDEANLAPEAEIQERAISYSKGCYIGQEIIARIRTYGQVARALRLLKLSSTSLPPRGTRIFKDSKEVGYTTSSTHSPLHGGPVALGYVRKECNRVGETLDIERPEGTKATILPLPAPAA